jgi:glycogen(starch) synthase
VARRLTICFVAELVSDPSGLARATGELAVALAAAGHRVHAFTSQANAELEGVTVHPVATALAQGPLADEPGIELLARAAAMHRAVSRLHAGEGVDVVLGSVWSADAAVCMLDSRFPTVITVLTTTATTRALRPRREASPLELRRIALERATLRRAPYLHGLTRAGLEEALSEYPEHSPAEIGIVGRGILDRAGAVSGSEPGPAGPVRLLFVGRLERRKGVDVLLDTAVRLAGLGVDFDLTLVGRESGDVPLGLDRSYREQFEAGPGRDRWLSDRVHFAGEVEDDELDRQYRAADIVCTAARFESHGVVLVEAMMYGKPIVATRVGGIPEVVEEGGNALLAEADDPDGLTQALRRSIEDAGMRARFAARSRQLYEERFAAEAVAKRMGAYLERVVERHAAESGDDSRGEDVPRRLAELVADTFEAPARASQTAADELLDPPADAWHAAMVALERERAAWQASAIAAEQGLARLGERSVENGEAGEWRRRALGAEAELRRLVDSRSWRATAPLRRIAARLRARNL